MSTGTEHFPVPVPPGTPVRIYRNLHARSWSVQIKAPTGRGRAHAWRVAGHALDVVVADAVFKVYAKGRARVLATGVKNVHAYVEGVLIDVDQALERPTLKARVSYNPRTLPYFHYVDFGDDRVDRAGQVHLDVKGEVWVRSRVGGDA
jgi:hypothetical protein